MFHSLFLRVFYVILNDKRRELKQSKEDERIDKKMTVDQVFIIKKLQNLDEMLVAYSAVTRMPFAICMMRVLTIRYGFLPIRIN